MTLDKLVFMFICSKGYDENTRNQCHVILKQTITQFELYKSLRSKEEEYREFAESRLSKPTVWLILTAGSTASTGKLYLTGHDVMGIDSVNLSISEKPQVSLTWTF